MTYTCEHCEFQNSPPHSTIVGIQQLYWTTFTLCEQSREHCNQHNNTVGDLDRWAHSRWIGAAYSLGILVSGFNSVNSYIFLWSKISTNKLFFPLFWDSGLDLWSRARWSWTINILEEYCKSNMLQEHKYLNVHCSRSIFATCSWSSVHFK